MMNRGRSSDSLDNCADDIVSSGSSSPTDFTSDDEDTGADNLFMISGQSTSSGKQRSRATLNNHQGKKADKYQMSRFRNDYSLDPLQSRHNLLSPAASRPVLGTNCQNNLTGPLSYIDHCTIEPSIASTSYYDNVAGNHLASDIDLRSTIIPDVQDPGSIALLPDRTYEHRRENQMDNDGGPFRLNSTNRRDGQAQRTIQSDTLRDLEDIDDYYNREDLLAEPYLEQSGSSNISRVTQSAVQQAIAGPSRGMNTISVRMCARLVECRSLVEAIEFIDQNRDLIDSLTRIITRDAPAFRNYDISNYPIDYSVKESFNPNFWLDREPVITTADGNCQYHAISLSLTGSEAYTQEVRLATAMAVIDNRDWFDSMLKLIDRGSVLDLVHTIARSYSWGDETTLKAVAVAIRRRIFLYTCNIGKKDYEMVKSLSKEELLDAFKEKKYRGGTGIHTYADPLTNVSANNYIMLFHKSEHFIAVLPMSQQPTMFEPYNPIVPVFS